MTDIVGDAEHAAEIVSEKGKAFKYDAIECMMNDYSDWEEVRPKLFLVNNYLDPGKLINAKEAQFLISESIPSPMGAFLSGFNSLEELNQVDYENGEILNWKGLKTHFEIE